MLYVLDKRTKDFSQPKSLASVVEVVSAEGFLADVAYLIKFS